MTTTTTEYRVRFDGPEYSVVTGEGDATRVVLSFDSLNDAAQFALRLNIEGEDERLVVPSEGQYETLGPCGCVDYHYADCPLRTGGSDMTVEDYYDKFSDPDYDDYYEEP